MHMNGGSGDTSYANNSLLQQKVMCLTKSIREEAIGCLFRTTLPERLAVADLGCSSGPNALFLASEFIKAVEKLCRRQKHQSPEYQIFLNDLPSNDFNTIFMSLHSFKNQLSHEMLTTHLPPCFITAVPGSFYGRLFPSKSLHFVHSSYSLQWLSQVPEGIENNKGNIYMGTRSPSNVMKAYYHQFQKDFSLFLKCRAEEVVEGGRMVLTLLGRRSQDPSSKECCYIWELLAEVLNQMVLEGIIREEEVNSFNIPNYTPSPTELKWLVRKEGSFSMNGVQVSEVSWGAACGCEQSDDNYKESAYRMAKCMRAVAQTLLVNHFGDSIIEHVFMRYQQVLAHRMSLEKPHFINLTLSLTRNTN
ncbi:salicylate carboxymethyltransferase-like [Senna tora]|uniref:Salicylate carboxymethyltransferase-like n=1 Tax=Senna tora TaxID=362788 RepID=A0A834WN23_9FABA|nr:salicylate carboxymethyltransferase-like [Senna tora]